jgi:hypothetical protein
MLRKWVPYAIAALLCALLAGHSAPASAEFFGCDDQHPARHVAYSYNAAAPYTRHYAQSRPRVTIHPRSEAKRYCRSRLVKEYRISGPVIVPRTYCWWQ